MDGNGEQGQQRSKSPSMLRAAVNHAGGLQSVLALKGTIPELEAPAEEEQKHAGLRRECTRSAPPVDRVGIHRACFGFGSDRSFQGAAFLDAHAPLEESSLPP